MRSRCSIAGALSTPVRSSYLGGGVADASILSCFAISSPPDVVRLGIVRPRQTQSCDESGGVRGADRGPDATAWAAKQTAHVWIQRSAPSAHTEVPRACAQADIRRG